MKVQQDQFGLIFAPVVARQLLIECSSCLNLRQVIAQQKLLKLIQLLYVRKMQTAQNTN
jgi:hypothetical protein